MFKEKNNMFKIISKQMSSLPYIYKFARQLLETWCTLTGGKKILILLYSADQRFSKMSLWLPKILLHTFHKIPDRHTDKNAQKCEGWGPKKREKKCSQPPSSICYIKSSQSQFSYVSSAKEEREKIFLFGMIRLLPHICLK